VRAANADDVPTIVIMGARSQQELLRADARMWAPHPEAPTRFGLWMDYSLKLPDRCIFISAERNPKGFVIAQPASPFHMPLTSPSDHVGMIDDFWADEFAANCDWKPETTARDLLFSAEQEFTRRKRTTAMVICAAAWPNKNDFLRASGYRAENAWLLKA
jgi:hypothetical protein